MTPATADSAVLKALGRAAVYRTLGSAFAYPTPPRLAELGHAADTAAGGELPTGILEALTAFAAVAREADPQALADEHVFLFDRQVRCPPYEGAWGDAPQLAGKAAALADIAGFYDAFGLGATGAQPDTEDHIVAELEFMSALAVKEAWAIGEEDQEGLEITRQAERGFLADHLGRWAPAFAEALRGVTPLPYYTAAAGLLEEWLRAEGDLLGVSPAACLGGPTDDPLQREDAFSCPMAEPEPETEGTDQP
ncbi:MAG TPA: molecular chaperone TorD family protein [Methylomirabilota bacterium]|jgi:TorA maturation chaperone TorD